MLGGKAAGENGDVIGEVRGRKQSLRDRRDLTMHHVRREGRELLDQLLVHPLDLALWPTTECRGTRR